MKKLITGTVLDGTEAKSLIAQHGIQKDVVELNGAFYPSAEFYIEDDDKFEVIINYSYGIQLHLIDEETRFSFALDSLRGQCGGTPAHWYAAA